MKNKEEQKKKIENDRESRKKDIKDLPPKQGDIIKGGEKVEAGSENVRR